MAVGGLVLLGLALALLLVKAFLAADPARLASALRWGLVATLGLAAAGLMVTGRAAMIGVFVPIAVPWLMRWRRRRGMPPPGDGTAGGTAGPSSAMDTDWLGMRLDHASGTLSGTVRRGRFRGRPLADLGDAELVALWRELGAADPPSVQLLEAYLERSRPGWRAMAGAGAAGAEDQASGQASGGHGAAMGRDEALRVLGLAGAPDRAAILEAHRRLMLANHPDRGGSAYLAALINQAKEVLTRPR